MCLTNCLQLVFLLPRDSGGAEKNKMLKGSFFWEGKQQLSELSERKQKGSDCQSPRNYCRDRTTVAHQQTLGYAQLLRDI